MKKFKLNKENRIGRIVAWSIIVVFFAIIVPLAINWAYKIPAINSIFAVDWEAKDALGFYGSILSAAATIFVLRETIVFTRDNQKEERKLSIKPYLETNKYNYTEIQDIPNDNVVFLDINKSLITYQGKIPDKIANMITEQKHISNHEEIDTIDEIVSEYSLEIFFKKKYIMLYEVENCGAGNAVNVEMKIGDFTLVPNFSITTDKPKKFVFILNDNLLQDEKYVVDVSITYSDVASLGRYSQKESFTFQRDSSGELQTFQFEGDLLTSPIELQK